jgi:hypothetical protein
VLQERTPGFQPLHKALAAVAGSGTVEANLTAVAVAATAFYHHNFPLFGSIFADPVIFESHRVRLGRLGGGPHKVNDALAAYLRAEQRAGRVRADADPAAAADLLVGACFQHAFLSRFRAADPDPRTASRFVATLHATLRP